MQLPSILLVLGVALVADAFYLPGVAPHEYQDGDKVDIKVHKLSSAKTQLPYDYYSLPFCKPSNITNAVENLGEVLHGAMIQNSPYMVYMGKSEFNVLCRVGLTEKERKNLVQKVTQDYRVHMIMDNLPAATKMISKKPDGKEVPLYDRGFRLGFIGSKDIPKSAPGTPYVNNHLRFIIQFHKDEQFEGSRIVGFEVEAYSVQHSYEGKWSADTKLTSVPFKPDTEPQKADSAEIIYSYDVAWQDSPIRWASRWDLYLFMGDDQIHWFSILNSLAIVLLLSGIVAMIIMRTVIRDLSQYNAEEREELLEESGWKLVHGDVFRAPPLPLLLAAILGSGMQVLSMGVIAIIFAMLGFLSPANRGSLISVTMMLFALMGYLAGYFAATTYNRYGGTRWRALIVTTACLVPGVIFFLKFIINFFIWGKASSGAVPFGTMVAVLALWFCISAPLVSLGTFTGYKRVMPDPPVKTNTIPRDIPEQPWYLFFGLSMLIGGVLPFGAVFIELFFIMSSVWLQRFYYVFGFLFLVLLILVLTCAEMAIVLVYFQLCYEDYRWHWRAFWNSGATGLFLFGYSFVYFNGQLEISGFVPILLYFGYMFIAAFAFTVLTGTIGYFAAYLFIWKIYSAVKVD